MLGILIALVTGIPIELLQNRFHRIPEIGDVWRDILGCLAGITFFSVSIRQISPLSRRIIRAVIIILILIEVSIPAISLADEITAVRQFPLISGFETPFETDRWTVDTRLERTRQQVYNGDYSASVIFNTDIYSRLSLKYFPRDWSRYQFLEFAVFYSGNQTFILNCRIHDGEHLLNNQKSDDRFNRQYVLKSGWNQIQISLEEVRNAPRNRHMNLKNIYDMTFFSYRLAESTTLFVYEVKLVRGD